VDLRLSALSLIARVCQRLTRRILRGRGAQRIQLRWLIKKPFVCVCVGLWLINERIDVMKVRIIFISIYLFSLILLFGGAAAAEAVSCIYCGMDKAKFGYSWVVIVNDDDTSAELCSIHCAAIYLALNTHQTIDAVTVGDYVTTEPIDADKAHWVIGGNKLGVMTSRAKWAFATKEAADKFIKEHGGQPAVFKEVIKAAFEDMYHDTVMIQKKRRLRKMLQPNPRN